MHSQTQKAKNTAIPDPVISNRSSTSQYSHPVLQLQQQLGNQAVQRLLQSKFIQAKLTIGPPNDIYEQEADRVADQIMRMPYPIATAQRQINLINQAPVNQRICTKCGEEEKLFQTKEMPGQTPELSNELENTINNLRRGGQPLSSTDLSFFEPRFGQDFSQVRIHTDPKAAGTAKAVNARAFTLGKDVVFGSGQYSPNTKPGKRLLAHELTHVIQQGQALSYTSKANGYRGNFTKSLSVIQRDALDAIGFSLRQSLTRAIEFPDPLARIFDGVVASNIAIASEITIPASYRQALLDYSALNPLDGVVLLAAIARFPSFYSGGWIMDLQPAAAAMTLDHSIFVPKGRSLSLSTYIHEMVHVAQYGLIGTTNFLTSYFGLSAATIAYRWARGQPTNPMRSSPHENQAYDLEARFQGR